MKLIEDLRNIEELKDCICAECQDNRVYVTIADQAENILILDLDKYYQKLEDTGETLASLDCLIIQFCQENRYNVYLVELKNVESSSAMSTKKKRVVPKKFPNCFDDFMSIRYKDYFLSPDYQLNIKLMVVAASVNDVRTKSVRLDFIDQLPVFTFNGNVYAISKEEPFPTISRANCEAL
ncbi:MAG: hypothetical protein MUE85_21050 [Microscillaceae bacterium]|jgi:hypothetical protein|nr:hypothetical protein [Microscillaceae bacterium]